ncbi:unnamed protein product [Effrenium voratum]|uniref:Methyltransferase FkbM domain-containing protein n=1 Tax=Effrenium voratum TaxID=2562239 RepID=A0AA36NAX9_9DINO|nr:unnamed protein product [Effrenium voratum]
MALEEDKAGKGSKVKWKKSHSSQELSYCLDLLRPVHVEVMPASYPMPEAHGCAPGFEPGYIRDGLAFSKVPGHANRSYSQCKRLEVAYDFVFDVFEPKFNVTYAAALRARPDSVYLQEVPPLPSFNISRMTISGGAYPDHWHLVHRGCRGPVARDCLRCASEGFDANCPNETKDVRAEVQPVLTREQPIAFLRKRNFTGKFINKRGEKRAKFALELECPRWQKLMAQNAPELVVNHREPSMRYAPEPPPRGPRRKLADIPLQPFQDTAAEFARLEMRTPHHFVLPYFDVNIGHAIKNQGSMNHLQSYQMQLLLRSGDTAIDVGANLGCYTIALAEAVGPRGSVIFFEPYRWLHQLVVANVALNGLQNVFPVQAALGESEERTWVYPPQLRFFSSPGGVRVAGQAQELSEKRQHEAFQLYDLLAQGPEAVRVVRLDDLLLDGETASRWALPQIQELRLIKIDVEGMEVAVVRGALGVISHFRPIIWAENLAYFDSGGKDTEFLQALAVVGYQCAKAESAPGDMICTDAGGQGHQVP